MHPQLFELGSVTISTYTALFALGALVALWISVRLARLTGMDRAKVFEVAFWAVVGGSVGAVLPELVLTAAGAKPGMLAGRWTQFGMAGAFLAGALAARWKGIPVAQAFDVCTSGAAMSHAIGRLGCLAAGCCWGTAFSGPWAVVYHDPELNSRIGVPVGIGVHPTQLYEAIAEALLACLAYRMMLRSHRTGQVMGTYLVLSSICRFGIEFVRAHPRQEFAGALSVAQWMAVLAAALGIALYINSGREKFHGNLLPAEG